MIMSLFALLFCYYFHQITPEREEPDVHEDDDIDRYLASTSTANTTANNTIGATRSLSLTPSSAHGVRNLYF